MTDDSQGELDLTGGRMARDEGMSLVALHNKLWMSAAIEKVIKQLPSGWSGQMEDLRIVIEDVIGKPNHPNIYGALTRKMIADKILYYPGDMRQMRRKSSHARRTLLLARMSHG